VRLFEKGLLERRTRGRKFIYWPRCTQQEWQRHAAVEAAARFLATPNVSRAMLASCLWEAILMKDPALLSEIERLIQTKRLAQDAAECFGE
jgi:predicted transcriptional regulator